LAPIWTATAQKPAQPQNSLYTRRHVLNVFAGYSGDSGHILEGQARDRKLVNIGVAYNRRIWANRVVNWQYSGEFLPVALVSDPVETTTYTVTLPAPVETITGTTSNPTVARCKPQTGAFSYEGGETETYTITCSRRWTMGEAMLPVGFQWNFEPARRLQPFFVGHGGYMYSTNVIPVNGAGAFNFTFDLGVGLEFYRTRRQTIRAEYRYHHISNAYIDLLNPGIDNGVVQVGYSFEMGH
jgi:opacity protein-like surface antigen